MTSETLIQATVTELAAVVGALLDGATTAESTITEVTARWAVALTIGGPFGATIVLGFDDEGARALAKQVMALDEVPADAAVSDTLLEVCGQAVSAVSQRNGFEGLRLAETRIVATPPTTPPTTMRLTSGTVFATSIACWASIDPVASVALAVPGASSQPASATATAAPANLDLILDIELPLTVRFGETEMTLLSLTRLAPGSIIDLGRSPDEPVDVLVNGRLVARGEVVVVSGNYGVRIVEVISAADRLKTVAA